MVSMAAKAVAYGLYFAQNSSLDNGNLGPNEKRLFTVEIDRHCERESAHMFQFAKN